MVNLMMTILFLHFILEFTQKDITYKAWSPSHYRSLGVILSTVFSLFPTVHAFIISGVRHGDLHLVDLIGVEIFDLQFE